MHGTMPKPWIQIGAIRSVHPVRREVRVRANPGCSRSFDTITWLHLLLRDGTELRCKVESVKTGKAGIRIVLGPGVPRDNVARMKGAAVLIAEQEYIRQPDSDRDVAELCDFQVLEQDGTSLGRIVDAYATGAHGVIEVAKPGRATMVLPVIEEVIADIDFDRGTVTVKDIAPFVVEEKRPVEHGR